MKWPRIGCCGMWMCASRNGGQRMPALVRGCGAVGCCATNCSCGPMKAMTPFTPPAMTPSRKKSTRPSSRGIRIGPRTAVSCMASTSGTHELTRWRPDRPAVREDRPPAQDRTPNQAAERAPDVGAELVAVEEVLAAEHEGLIQIHQREVGVDVRNHLTLERNGETPCYVGSSCQSNCVEPKRWVQTEHG